jgi:hypothetical protein
MTSVGVYRKWRGGGGGCGVTCGVTVLEVVRPVFDESWHGVETLSQLLEPGEVCLGQGLKRIEAVTGTMQGCNTPGSGVPLGLRHGRARSGSRPCCLCLQSEAPICRTSVSRVLAISALRGAVLLSLPSALY